MFGLRDLGLSYEQALHGIQTAVLHEMNIWEEKNGGNRYRSEVLKTSDTHPNGPKHTRVGLNMRACDHAALASVLIEKGVITEEEYLERLRLFANEELARYEDSHPEVTFR